MKFFINFLTIIGLAVFILILGFLILITWKMPIHNFNLWRLSKNFESVSAFHPLLSKRLLKFSDFGNFGESGGQCGYIVGEFRVSQLTKEEILNYFNYKNLTILSFKEDKTIPLEIYFLDDDMFRYYPWSKWLLYFYQKKGLSNQSSSIVYLAIAQSYNHLADGDIRCYISK